MAEMLMLDDDERMWFAAIVGAARARPDFAPGQSLFQSAIESAQAWSAAA